VEPGPPRALSLFLVAPTLCLVGIVLFVALLYRRGDLILLALLVLGVAAGAKLWARLGRAGVTHRLRVDRTRLFPGERLEVAVAVENRRCLPVYLRVVLPVGRLGPDGAARLQGEGGLLWYQRTDLRWALRAPRRGVHRIGPAALSAGDLFDFFTSPLPAGASREVLVYPRIVPLRQLAVPRRDFFGLPGAAGPVRDPVYILGTRDYQPGGPARHIHWKASARHARLQEKVFEPTAQEKVLLVLDVEDYARQEAEAEFERAVEAVASLAVQLDREGCAVGLLANGQVAGEGGAVVPIRRGARQLPALLERLARLCMRPAASIREVVRGELPGGASALCFALEAGAGPRALLDHLARRRVRAILFTSRAVPPSHAAGDLPGDVRPLAELLLEGRP